MQPGTALAEMQSWACTTSLRPGGTAVARVAIERVTRWPTLSPSRSTRGITRVVTAGSTGR